MNVEFVQGDIEEMPFSDNDFDGLFELRQIGAHKHKAFTMNSRTEAGDILCFDGDQR